MSALHEWQQGVARALLTEGDEVAMTLQQGAIPAEALLQIYRNHFILSLSEALAATYPAVAAMVGEEYFAAAARGFVLATPLNHGTLQDYGEGFDGWLASLPTTAHLPWLADLARFEWVRERCALRPHDPRHFDPDSLAGLDPVLIGKGHLVPVQDLCLFRAEVPVAALWAMALSDGAAPDALDSPCWLALRKGADHRVVGIPLTPEQWQLLVSIEAGDTLDTLASEQSDLLATLATLLPHRLIAGWQPNNKESLDESPI
ncbi:putative DNA-binding domain-containing protein [Aeromonas schubertii]|uniref:HvfC/BufC family peptide modification chaperone n=1 Tax=Aeromonas schubertii TaxID=652 RepID=UPI0038B619FC